jgi:hypothetical protein
MEKINLTAGGPVQAAASAIEPAAAAPALKTTLGEVKPKKRTNRPAKRRR